VIDAFAYERQFLDHVAPVWRALPADVRGTLYTDPSLAVHALSMGLSPEFRSVDEIRRSSPPPRAVPSGDGPAAFVVSIGDTKVARRLGYRRFAFMEHGAGQAYVGDRSLATRRHQSYSGGMDREDVELFMVPNDYSARLWRSAYPAARVEVVGSPRLDDLPRRRRDNHDEPTVAVSFHWPAHVAPEAYTALGHYMRVLPELARAYHVIGHAHPKADWPARMRRIYDRAGIEFVADFADVCRRADVYACDNSSTIFEFAATGRPVVVLNAPMYRRNVNHGLRFWDAASVGVNVDEPGDLVDAVSVALSDETPLPEDRERALDIVYAYRTGAAGRAAAALVDWSRTALRGAA